MSSVAETGGPAGALAPLIWIFFVYTPAFYAKLPQNLANSLVGPPLTDLVLYFLVLPPQTIFLPLPLHVIQQHGLVPLKDVVVHM
jgi:hypothetical protein